MVEVIICKVYNKKHNIGILHNGSMVTKVDGVIIPVKKEVHQGAIHYRAKGSSKRISSKQLNNKKFLVYNYIIQVYCPI